MKNLKLILKVVITIASALLGMVIENATDVVGSLL